VRLREASRRFPGEPSYGSLRLWGTVGQRSKRSGQLVTLDIFQIGGVWHTTEEAYQRFLNELNTEQEDDEQLNAADTAGG